ncbi:Uncharacterised protein [Vibrio cholerae]|nr:Uncharacterised protein [Vibrio cholerae]CSI96888.1 Uncharacterised protein [Vibrio cholerae]
MPDMMMPNGFWKISNPAKTPTVEKITAVKIRKA